MRHLACLLLVLALPMSAMASPIGIGSTPYFPTDDAPGVSTGGGGTSTGNGSGTTTGSGTGTTNGGTGTTGTGTGTITAAPKDPWAGVKLVNCGQYRSMSCDKLSRVKIEDMQQCIQRGFDPGLGCRPRGGVKVSGASGFSLGGIADPKKPPYKVNRNPSVPSWKIDFSLKFPPWASGEDKPDDAGSAAGGANACPELVDATDVFGESVAVEGGKSYNLACGGAMPLSSYPLTLSRNPTGFASTENGSYYLWNYNKQGSAWKLTGGGAMALPQYLCTRNTKTKKMEKSLDLPPPRSQIIVYNSSMNALLLRVVDPAFESSGELLADESQIAPEDAEKYLVIPMAGGTPQIPANCANQADYYKHVALQGDIVLTPNTDPPCEGADCDQYGGGGSITGGASTCETQTIYPSGDTTTTNGTVSCTGKTQVLVVDRPNLVFLPTAKVQTESIEGRTAVMALSGEGSQLYLNSQTLVTLPTAGQTYTLSNGGTLGLKNHRRLVMYPKASIDGSGRANMYGGGAVREADGSTITDYKANTAVTPDVGYPLKLLPDGSIDLPAGFAIPSQPNPYVQGPAGE